jgi:hypothetical protein
MFRPLTAPGLCNKTILFTHILGYAGPERVDAETAAEVNCSIVTQNRKDCLA